MFPRVGRRPAESARGRLIVSQRAKSVAMKSRGRPAGDPNV